MFKKRRDRQPLRNPLAKAARLAAILQLCVAFSFLFWHGGYPFLGKIYELKEKLAVYEFVMGISQSGSPNKIYFDSLPDQQKNELAKHYEILLQQREEGFLSKPAESIRHLLIDLPLFQKIWLLLALVLPVSVLLRIEGADIAIWLLPLAALAFAGDNLLWSPPSTHPVEAKLYPSEENLIRHYLGRTLSPAILDQQKDLRMSWNNYLQAEWGDGDLQKGAFRFQKARIDAWAGSNSASWEIWNVRQSGFWLALYLLWNTWVAWSIYPLRPRRKVCPI